MAQNLKFEELPIEKLRWRCPVEKLDLKTSDDVEPCDWIIGQDRAVKAIKLGLDIKSIGYNIFVTGFVGTGRMTAIKHLLEKLKKKDSIPDDKCYVNNFKNPDLPRAICLPAGEGKLFRKDMENLMLSLKKNIPSVFESEAYKEKRKEFIKESEEGQKAILAEFEKEVKKESFALVQIQIGPYVKPDIQPVIEGKPISLAKLEKQVKEGNFPKEKFTSLQTRYEALAKLMEDVFKEGKEIVKELEKALDALDKEVIVPLIRELIKEIKAKYENEKVQTYLDEVEESLIDNLDRFKPTKEKAPEGPLAGFPFVKPEDEFLEYRVNVVVDNSETKTVPIIIETNPTYKNLFGTIERVADRGGMWRTDFTRIKAGSYLKANGGYLVLNALDLLIEPGSWQALKRALKYGRVEIGAYDPFYLLGTSAMKPEPIETKVDVVLIGTSYIYHLLYHLDEDFKKIFKVKADFDSVMPKDEQNIHQYACFIKKICDEDKLLPFDKSGVGGVVEFGVRVAGSQKKLSTRFTIIADLIREASYWATNADSKVVKHQHVEKAIEEWIKRVNLVEDKIQEMIEDGTIMIDSEGEVSGQINGLSVYDMGEYAFGKPTRITARTSMGRAGVINIEREADLSGRTHNKGVLILGGYLRGKYAQDKPLTVSASICFEQSYSGVEGDSASSTEVYAILSSLSGLPLKQDVAVTGSINQKGEIQPIGGVNEKIEGFYHVCKAFGLTGTQGVMIPHQNVKDLMLKNEVVQAVKQGKFHIYPVKTIDQGIEILTGVKAGERKEDGTFEEGSVNFLVDKQLRQYAEDLKRFGAEEARKEEKS
ncbi:MAG: ATP-dependent protease [candidate division Zixibacteria bacterium SM23_73_3]|nr:MAG: ATP-dependent protease [candidate division Zixibacteria bacterium SM23_73_3]